MYMLLYFANIQTIHDSKFHDQKAYFVFDAQRKPRFRCVRLLLHLLKQMEIKRFVFTVPVLS